MASKDVVYKPLTQVTPDKVEAPKRIDEPSYPDKGVSFAGYSKKLISGNNFILTPQDKFDRNASFTFDGVVANYVNVIDQSPNTTRNIYIPWLNFDCKFTSDTIINLFDYNTGNAIATFYVAGGSVQSRFIDTSSVPVKVNGYGVRWNFSPVPPVGDKFYTNLYGWVEDA